MSRFTFRLEAVARLRSAERDQRRARLAEALRAEQMLQQRRHQLELEGRAIRAQTRTLSQPGEVSVEGLLAGHRYEIVLRVQRHQLDAKLVELREEIERRREELVEADRQVKMLEKLRQRKWEEHQHADLRREYQDLDEIAQQRYQRGSGQ